MIKIKKANNIFGIKSLSGAETLGKLNVIYAPNGTAKSSIADAIKYISVGEPVNDVYGESPSPTYEFDVDGVLISETNLARFNVIKYCGVENFDLNNNNNYSNLVISPSAKSLLASSITSINDSLNKIESILLSSFVKKGKGKGQKFSNSLIDSLLTIAKNIDNITLNFALNFKTLTKQLGEMITEEDVLNLVNSKGKEILQKPEVKSSIANYASIISKKTISKILDSNFDIDKLNSFKKHIIEDDYFDNDKKRQLHIDNENVDKDVFLSMVEIENKNVYGSNEVKIELDKCKDALNKNAGSAKFSKVLLSKPSLVKHSLDYESFANEMFVTFLGAANVKLIENEIVNIKKEQANISLMESSLSGDDNVLHEIWEKFKSRFKFNKYDLDIKNKFDAITGNDLPMIIKCQPGTNKEITDPALLRFSTGEIRSYYLINLIIEVERAILLNQSFTIILDDAVDSFDYKNKYGIIDYLMEIKDNPNIQIIILTHNFDFYRSSVLSLGKNNTNQYFMYRDNLGNVSLHDVKAKGYYLTVTDFNSWKNTGSDIKYLSFIPFLRNVLQLETNSHNSSVADVDKYLHFEVGVTDSLDFTIIKPLMDRLSFGLPSSINVSENYLNKLDTIASNVLIIPIRETDLDLKIVLGLYIRLFLEKFLSERIIKRSGMTPTYGNNYARTTSLINQAKAAGYLSEEELSVVIEANVISPSYIHANSFMYEPLIDIDSSTLVAVANKIKNLDPSL